MYTAILLAAGRSSRMGEPKGLLPWEGKPLLLHQVEQLLLSRVNRIIVVLGHQYELYEPMIETFNEKLSVIKNDSWQQGKSSSVLTGLEGLEPGTEAILFVNIDQPLSFNIANLLLDSYESSDALIHIPVLNGRKGHPLLVSGSLLDSLRLISEETQGLKQVIRHYENEISYVEMEEMSVLYNFNSPTDYKRGIAHCESRK